MLTERVPDIAQNFGPLLVLGGQRAYRSTQDSVSSPLRNGFFSCIIPL